MLIRAIEPEDLDLMYVIENDVSLWQYSSHSAPFSHYQLKRYLSECQSDIYKDGQVRFTIVDDNGTACGFVDLENFDAADMRAEVGIVLLPEARHKGLATMAVKEIQKYARQIGLVQLWAEVSENNASANILFETCGFTHTATLKGWIANKKTLANNAGYSDAFVYQWFAM